MNAATLGICACAPACSRARAPVRAPLVTQGPSQAMSAEAEGAVDAGALVQECPVLRALGAFDNLLSQGAEGVRSPSRMRQRTCCVGADAAAAAARVPAYLPAARGGGEAALREALPPPGAGRAADQAAPCWGAPPSSVAYPRRACATHAARRVDAACVLRAGGAQPAEGAQAGRCSAGAVSRGRRGGVLVHGVRTRRLGQRPPIRRLGRRRRAPSAQRKAKRSSPNAPAVPRRCSQRCATWRPRSAVPWRGCTTAGLCTAT